MTDGVVYKDSLGRDVDVSLVSLFDPQNPSKDYTHKIVACAKCGTDFVIRKDGIAVLCRDCQNKIRAEKLKIVRQKEREKKVEQAEQKDTLPLHVDYQTEKEKIEKAAPIETCLVKKRDMSDFPSLSNRMEKKLTQYDVEQSDVAYSHTKVDMLNFISQLYRQIYAWCGKEISPKHVVDLLRSMTYDLEAF